MRNNALKSNVRDTIVVATQPIKKGETVVDGAHYIDRGYENIDEKLKKLGVDIKRAD